MTNPTIYTGPSDHDPLTADELRILLALPRAAKNAPHSLLFRLPNGDHPSQGYVDVSCLQACSIVARLAARWHTRLTACLGNDVGPGTTICLAVDPFVDAIFHQLAFWALGCTVQYTTIRFGDGVVDRHLKESGCKVVVYSGKTEAWVSKRRELHGIEMIELPEDEYARTVAREEKASSDTAPEWPIPKRPSPALIIQSSSTTGDPKMMSFSLHFYTIGLAWNCKHHLASKPFKSTKDPRTHPRLILNRQFWQAFHSVLVEHLVTATPVAFLPSPELCRPSAQELPAWIKALEIGGLVSYVQIVRDLVLADAHTEVLQSLYSIIMIGSPVNEQFSDMITQKQLRVTNRFGTSEMGRLLLANRAPFTHLRPFPYFPPPLAVPISNNASYDPHSNELPGLEVQLWYLADSCPQLANVAFRGGVPLKLEPFPGPGPARGRLAVNLGDVFNEIRLRKGTEDEEVVYAHVGRLSDYLWLGDGNGQYINASPYEIEIQALVGSGLRGSCWTLDAVQLFGSNLPKTALVVQLLGEAEPDEAVIEMICRAVETASDNLGLTQPEVRVDPFKRLLVTTHGVSGSGGTSGSSSTFSHLRLSYTHKHTLRRWENVEIFGAWLEQLDWA